MLTPEQLDYYEIVDPTAPEVVAIAERRGAAAGPRHALEGLPIAYLFNGKQGGDVLFAALDGWLTEQCGTTSLGISSKLVASQPAKPETLADMAARARLVVTGPGD